MDMELRHLRALVAVVDAGTFTDAAVALGCSQPSVSRSIAALEAALGTRLMERSKQHVVLTGSGIRVVAHARRVLEIEGVDEWLTLIAAGQAVGMTAEATANQNPRPGVAYRIVTDAPEIEVRLAWWKDDPPAQLPALVEMTRELYAAARPAHRP